MNDTNNIKENSNITLNDLQGKLTSIQDAYKALGDCEKTSANKSYIIGSNLNELHESNQFRQLTDSNGNTYQKWDSFCKDGCGFTRAYADKLMKCAEIQDKLEDAKVTTIKQSVANLYALHKAASKGKDIMEIWKTATANDSETFPARKDVQKAISPESHADNGSQTDGKNLNKLVHAIKSLSEEDTKKVQAFLDDLLHKAEASSEHQTGVTQDEGIEAPMDGTVCETEKLSA